MIEIFYAIYFCLTQLPYELVVFVFFSEFITFIMSKKSYTVISGIIIFLHVFLHQTEINNMEEIKIFLCKNMIIIFLFACIRRIDLCV